MDNRPQFLSLMQIHLPITGWVSILHRISGLIIFLLIPAVFCAFQCSLESNQSFIELKRWLTHPVAYFFSWGLLAAFTYHIVAGLRHILMDMHIGVGLKGGRFTAWLTVLVSFGLIGYLAFLFWG